MESFQTYLTSGSVEATINRSKGSKYRLAVAIFTTQDEFWSLIEYTWVF